MNYINNLPDELIEKIYKTYFTENVVSHLNTMRCHAKIYLDAGRTRYIRCNMRCYDSVYCMHCKLNTIEYY